MPEKLWEILFALNTICRWFGKFVEGSAVVLIGRLAKCLELDTVEKLEKFVESCEQCEGSAVRAWRLEQEGEVVYRCPVEGCKHFNTINGNTVYHLAKIHGIRHDGTRIV